VLLSLLQLSTIPFNTEDHSDSQNAAMHRNQDASSSALADHSSIYPTSQYMLAVMLLLQ
jgi:hypothetical protein